MVEHIVRIRANLQAHPLSDGECFGKRQVNRAQPGAGQLIAPLIAECPGSGNSKGGLIEPLRDSTFHKVWVAYDVRIPGKAAAARGIRGGTVAHNRSKGLTALDDEQARDLPTTDKCIEDSAVVCELPALTKGQLIEEMTLESVSYIKVRVAIVSTWIVGILPTLIT